MCLPVEQAKVKLNKEFEATVKLLRKDLEEKKARIQSDEMSKEEQWRLHGPCSANYYAAGLLQGAV